MADYSNENKGALFKQREKKSDKHADYTGEINIDGQAYWLNGWIRQSKQGNSYLSLSVKPKESQGIPPHPASQKAQPKAPARDSFDDDSDVPF